jgi:hypothetical protein
MMLAGLAKDGHRFSDVGNRFGAKHVSKLKKPNNVEHTAKHFPC